MRFMIIVKATPQSESGAMPDEPLRAAIANDREQRAPAGGLLNANGQQPSSKGWCMHHRLSAQGAAAR